MSLAIDEIIYKLEAAPGPDRSIDAAIQKIVGGRVLHIGAGGLTNAFTGSLDAARTLMDPSHSFGGLAQVSPRDWIMVIFDRHDDSGRWEGEARSAELAICIAALKAMAT